MKKYGYKKDEVQAKDLEISMYGDDEIKGWFSQRWDPPWPLSPSEKDGSLLFFENGLVVNLNDNHARILSDFPEKRGVPKSFVSMENGRLKEVPQENPTLPLSAILIKTKDSYKSTLVEPALARSMLIRLYFFKGEGLKYFKLYHKEEDENGQGIYVYQVQWPQNNEH
jgi:hypothetical protein